MARPRPKSASAPLRANMLKRVMVSPSPGASIPGTPPAVRSSRHAPPTAELGVLSDCQQKKNRRVLLVKHEIARQIDVAVAFHRVFAQARHHRLEEDLSAKRWPPLLTTIVWGQSISLIPTRRNSGSSPGCLPGRLKPRNSARAGSEPSSQWNSSSLDAQVPRCNHPKLEQRNGGRAK